MARPSVAARNLSMTEELEKLEQSITLTLQEIDHNFSKAHRIVTTSILPFVEQYGENSKAVWEASKFWKQFFEASANVSLSGYEDMNNDNDNDTTGADESTALREDTSVQKTPGRNEDYTAQTGADDTSHIQPAHDNDESLFDDEELSGSTPRPPATKTVQADSQLESPYESLKREMREQEGEQTTVLQDDDEDSTVLFAQRTARLPDISLTPRQLIEKSGGEQSAQRGKDPLLHRVLDKNYRIQATPHKPPLRVSPLKSKGKERAEPTKWDDEPLSSPEIAAPKLRSEAFMSPYKAAARGRVAGQGPRTPGVSVQTPGTARKTRNAFGDKAVGKQDEEIDIDWDLGEEVDDEDLDLYAGMSPPKTIQFALPPSKLMQTPAREASKRIVDDILLNAGADPESSEYSPTVVKMNEDILNDSF